MRIKLFRIMEDRTLATQIRVKREELGMSVEDLAREARISLLYARALEAGEWRVFTAKVYAHGVLRRMIGVIEPDDGAEFFETFNREWPPTAGRKMTSSAGGDNMARGDTLFLLTPRRLGALIVAIAFLAILGFWGLRLAVFAAPPSLSIEIPADLIRAPRPMIAVRGTTEKESRLTVNGRELTIDERGNFDQEIELPLGANRLEFVSESRFGKISKEVRYVLVQ